MHHNAPISWTEYKTSLQDPEECDYYNDVLLPSCSAGDLWPIGFWTRIACQFTASFIHLSRGYPSTYRSALEGQSARAVLRHHISVKAALEAWRSK